MKPTLVLLFCIFSTTSIMAQQQAIKFTNTKSQKEFVIKENKRVKVRSVGGKLVKGRLGIEGDTILVGDHRLELSEIAELQRNPFLLSTVAPTLLIYGGAVTLGFGVLIGVLVDSTAYWLAIPAVAMIYAGVKAPKFNRQYRNDGSWTFQIVTLPDKKNQ